MDTNFNLQRRGFLARAVATGIALEAIGQGAAQAEGQAQPQGTGPGWAPDAGAAAVGQFWPNGARLVISVSMQFEAGGQPPLGADSPFPKIDFPPAMKSDPVSNTWFAYGYREGVQRMLDLWDKHGVKVTSHMIGEAAQKHPALAREIVKRGHEAAGHGPRWSSQYGMNRETERRFLIDARDMVRAATGETPQGYNCNWLRRGPNTLSLLQELGYLYHIDDVSRDEPFIEQVNGKDFMVVPYTLRNNDIVLVEGRNYSPQQFLEQLKAEFDQLYEEAGSRRRMMSVSAHDRISGSPQMVWAWDQFLKYAKSKAGVAFMRKDDIARFALSSPITVRESETI